MGVNEKHLSTEEVIEVLKYKSEASKGRYLSMYSSWYGGYVTDPSLMILPIDDHMVHRGDGIFEAFRLVKGELYDLEAHLDRLERSAKMIQIELPFPREQIRSRIMECARLADVKEAVLRLYVSRGPGGFGVNPYESVGSQLYIVATAFTPVSQDKRERGWRVMISQVPPKTGPYAQVKSCNYLPNALMKKESVDQGFDVAISMNSDGTVCEGATENIFIITKNGRLVAPKLDYTLQGTTLQKVMDLAREHLVPSGQLKEVVYGDLRVDDIKSAQEVALAGTTIGVFPVVEFDGTKIENGRPGPLSVKLQALLGFG